jgi:hypothetical protein
VIGLALLYPPFAQWLLKKISQRGLNAAMGGFGKSAGGGQGPQPNPFGGWGGFGAPHNGGAESPSSSSSDPRSHRAQREAPLREGIHRTQRPQPDAWERERAQESRSRVNPQEVIIDVDAEVVDD